MHTDMSNSYTIGRLITMVRDKKNLPQILSERNFKININSYHLHNGQFQSFLDLIKIFKNNLHIGTDININVCDILNRLGAVHSTIDNDQAKQLIDIITEENYDIEKILYKIYKSDAIINVVNACYYSMINYDIVFDNALVYNSDNRAIFEHIISNNYIDYNTCDYEDKDFYTYDLIDVLLSHGFDISKFPIDNTEIKSMLNCISLQNLKYFSCVKIDLSQYVAILISLEDDKLKEFTQHYNIENIVYPETNKNKTKKKIDRAQILMDSGINLKSILNVIVNGINNCECDCLENE